MNTINKMKKQKLQKKQEANSNSYHDNFAWEGPIIPATKISPEVIEILRTTKVPELIIPSHTTVAQAAEIYFKQYMKLFQENKKLNDEIISVFESRNQLAQKYNTLKSFQKQSEQNIRRKRRYASEIVRDFCCPRNNCHKSYGSEGSLTQHVKLKHEEYYKSGEYQIQLQKIVDEVAKKTGKQTQIVDEVKIETQMKANKEVQKIKKHESGNKKK